MNRYVIALSLLLLTTQFHAKCVAAEYSPLYNEWKGHEDIAAVICEDIKGEGVVYLDRFEVDWARAYVDKKTLYYLKLIDKKWTSAAKGPRFDIEMWDKLEIPSKIR